MSIMRMEGTFEQSKRRRINAPSLEQAGRHKYQIALLNLVDSSSMHMKALKFYNLLQ